MRAAGSCRRDCLVGTPARQLRTVGAGDAGDRTLCFGSVAGRTMPEQRV
jgi:hypothetical protein